MTHTTNIVEMRDAALAQSNSSLNVHDNLKGMSIPELQEHSLTDRLPWHTMCLNITGDLNVGTMVRTSHCLGATSVIVFGRQRIDNRSLVGAGNYIKFEKISGVDENLQLNFDKFAEIITERNLTPIFVEGGGLNLSDLNWKIHIETISLQGSQPCLIMGNETDGIPQKFLDRRHEFPNSFIVSIPQRGVIRSFNVGVAHAIVSGSMCSSMNWM